MYCFYLFVIISLFLYICSLYDVVNFIAVLSMSIVNAVFLVRPLA